MAYESLRLVREQKSVILIQQRMEVSWSPQPRYVYLPAYMRIYSAVYLVYQLYRPFWCITARNLTKTLQVSLRLPVNRIYPTAKTRFL